MGSQNHEDAPTLTDKSARLRDLLHRKLAERIGPIPPDLQSVRVEMDGKLRNYELVPAIGPSRGIILAAHGARGTGMGMAALTGLGQLGPAAGFSVVFPDGWNQRWVDPLGDPPSPVDDIAFLRRITRDVASDTGTDPSAVYATGISNGAFLCEQIARHHTMDLRGVALIAGGATVSSRHRRPLPSMPTTVVIFAGTADPLVPYEGGPVVRPGRKYPNSSDFHRAVATEDVAADWALANGVMDFAVTSTTTAPGDLDVVHTAWESGGAPTVDLFRIEGGGHAWPGGPAGDPGSLVLGTSDGAGRRTGGVLPVGLVGPVVGHLDATRILLERFLRW